MKKSAITKKYETLYWIFAILSFLFLVGPLAVFVISGYAGADLTTEKITLTCTIFIAVILTIVNALFKYNIRSILWILLLGIYTCLDNVLPLIIMLAVGTILDEFIFSPLKKAFKTKYEINKEMDKRL